MHVIGEETSQRLDVIPAQYGPKYACRACGGGSGAAPERLIKAGLPTVSRPWASSICQAYLATRT